MLNQEYPSRIQSYDKNGYLWNAVMAINHLMTTADFFSYREFDRICKEQIPEYMRTDLYDRIIDEFANAGYIQKVGSDVWQKVPEPRN